MSTVSGDRFSDVGKGYSGGVSRLAIGLVVMLAFGGSGCSNLPPNLAGKGGIDVVRLDSAWSRLGSPRAAMVDEGLRITGRLSQRGMRRGRIAGHLHVEVLSETGDVLAESYVRYYRRKVKSLHSHYSVTLPVTSGEVRTIRVIHHGLSSNHS